MLNLSIELEHSRIGGRTALAQQYFLEREKTRTIGNTVGLRGRVGLQFSNDACYSCLTGCEFDVELVVRIGKIPILASGRPSIGNIS